MNDKFGHAAGDALLQEVARRLQQTLRESDTVARLGGDEFAVIFSDINNSEDGLELAQKLWSRVTGQAEVPAGHEETAHVEISLSLGVAIYPDHGTEEDEIMHVADLALYAVKNRGKAGCGVYQPEV